MPAWLDSEGSRALGRDHYWRFWPTRRVAGRSRAPRMTLSGQVALTNSPRVCISIANVATPDPERHHVAHEVVACLRLIGAGSERSAPPIQQVDDAARTQLQPLFLRLQPLLQRLHLGLGRANVGVVGLRVQSQGDDFALELAAAGLPLLFGCPNPCCSIAHRRIDSPPS